MEDMDELAKVFKYSKVWRNGGHGGTGQGFQVF